jgi:hypothetical protein
VAQDIGLDGFAPTRGEKTVEQVSLHSRAGVCAALGEKLLNTLASDDRLRGWVCTGLETTPPTPAARHLFH